MGNSSKESLGKKTPSTQAINELMELLGKLNAKLREKIAPRRNKEDRGLGNMEMVIIILNHSSENAPEPSRPEKEKPKPLKKDWVDFLCEEIEQGSRPY
ncbi:MAG: hypothetical protein Q7W38_00625 [Deltaproteobacteria bacterium]|nr:hypothetical protein [Deltaproteobacteria bacterium]